MSQTVTPSVSRLFPGEGTGLSDDGGITAKKVLQLTILADPGSLVQLFNADDKDTMPLASATTGSYDNCILTTGTLPDGSYKSEVTATDLAGNVVPVTKDSAFTAVTIESVAPAIPAAPNLDAGSDTGILHRDGLTDVDTRVITGSTEADATVELFDGSVMVGKATANDSGAYAITAHALADGAHTLTVKAVDAAERFTRCRIGLGLPVGPNVDAPLPFGGWRGACILVAIRCELVHRFSHMTRIRSG